MKSLLLTCLFFLAHISVSGQIKIEKEERIKPQEVPKKAPDWISQNFSDIKRIKWFKQIEDNYQSYEAKFKSNGLRFSVEFENTAVLKNVEIETEFDKILSPAKEMLTKKLEEKFIKFKFKKIQFEYLPANLAFQNFSEKIKTPLPVPDFYEIELVGKTPEETKLYEARFDALGKLVQMREIKNAIALNLKY